MAARALALGLLSILFAASAAAQDTPQRHLVKPSPLPVLCSHGVDCTAFKHLISVPANALSYAPAPAFSLHVRGVNWLAASGGMSLTIHRPTDFVAGGKIKLTFFYQVTNDASGTIKFNVEPMAFNSGNSYETYGSQSTNTTPAPENPTIVLQQTVVIAPGNGWNPDRDWWVLEITRQGTYTGSLRMMSVAIEY